MDNIAEVNINQQLEATDLMDEKLTINDIEKGIEQLERQRVDSFAFHTSNFLRGSQTIIKDGNNIYCPPDIQRGQIKVLTLKDPSIFRKSSAAPLMPY